MSYDVVAVNIDTNVVRFIANSKSLANAEAIVKMAIMRRGVDEEFFSEVVHGLYEAGELWQGEKKEPA